jgi:hypothetical protein
MSANRVGQIKVMQHDPAIFRAVRKDKGQGRPNIERGRNLPNGISHKCATGRCKDCTALRCQHDCGHGSKP